MLIGALPPAVQGVAKLVESKSIVTGSNTVAHGLARVPVGWIVAADDARPVYIQAYRAASLPVVQNTATKIIMDTAPHDWGGDFSVTTGLFTAPHSGVYSISGSVGLLVYLPDQAYFEAAIDMNGVKYRTGRVSQDGSTGSGTGYPVLNLSHKWIMTSLTTAYVEVYHTGGGSRSLSTGKDDTRISISSDESIGYGAHDSTNLYVYSGRSRTMSFWVW